jgi:hypothetical protein
MEVKYLRQELLFSLYHEKIVKQKNMKSRFTSFPEFLGR